MTSAGLGKTGRINDTLAADRCGAGPAQPAAPGDACCAAIRPASADRITDGRRGGSTADVAAELTSARFAGGSDAEVNFVLPISHDRLSDMLIATAAGVPGIEKGKAIFVLNAPGYEPGSDATFNQWRIRTALPTDTASEIFKQVNDTLSHQPYFPGSSNIGASVASATQQQAAVAMFASLVLILAYIWFRFSQVMFGVAGVVAVIHDVLVTLGGLGPQHVAGADSRAGVPVDRAVQDQSADHRGVLDDHRLLAERHDRDLRPHSRDARQEPDHLGRIGQRRRSIKRSAGRS